MLSLTYRTIFAVNDILNSFIAESSYTTLMGNWVTMRDGRRILIGGGGYYLSDSRSTYLDTEGHQSSLVDRDRCFKFTCPDCQKEVYYVEHNDGKVWFDHLGWPWPKHNCGFLSENDAVAIELPKDTLLAHIIRCRAIEYEDWLTHTETNWLMALQGQQKRWCVKVRGPVQLHVNDFIYLSDKTVPLVWLRDGRQCKVQESNTSPVRLGLPPNWVRQKRKPNA